MELKNYPRQYEKKKLINVVVFIRMYYNSIEDHEK